MAVKYDVATICLNGHCVTSVGWSRPECITKFCSKCGQATIDACPGCHATIRGHESVDGHIGISMGHVPCHCYECGAPYPWTDRKVEALRAAIAELEDLPKEERERMVDSVPDLIADTPMSETAGLRVKKAIAKVGKVTGEVFKNVLAKVATEAVKKSLGI